MASGQDKTAPLIDGPDDIDPNWLAEVRTIGPTAGASTPPALVRTVGKGEKHMPDLTRSLLNSIRELRELDDERLPEHAARDGVRTGGIGTMLTQAATDAGIASPVHNLGLPRRFIEHGDRAGILEAHGYSDTAITHAARRALSGMDVYRHDPDAAPPEWIRQS